MGTDIHMIAERYTEGRWSLAGEVGTTKWGSMSMPEPYDGRNYDLFAILADVRNGYGFAGIETGSGFNVIAPPRGVPDDCSPEFRRWREDWGPDGHTPSWVTLAEILAFDWTQKTTKTGVVDVLNFPRAPNVRPLRYSGSVLGRDVVSLTNEEMAALQREIREYKGLYAFREVPYLCPKGWDPEVHRRAKNSHTRVHWEETYAELCAEFWSTTIPALLRMGAPEHVRLCFFFDN